MRRKNVTPSQHKYSNTERIKRNKGDLFLLPIILMSIVVTKRIKVGNKLYKKGNHDLLAAGRLYVSSIAAASGLFASPSPDLADCTTELNKFQQAILDAMGGGDYKVDVRNKQRETVLMLLSNLSLYVEGIANRRANTAIGAAVIIETAGMRVMNFTPRQRSGWQVKRGKLSGALNLTAAYLRGAIHQWQYTTTPGDGTSWKEGALTSKSKTTLSDLPRAALVYCRHRTISKKGASDWEGHDGVVVG